MFKFLRTNAKFLYWVIAITFVGFIFLAWGMDFAGGGGGGQGPGTIGKINGVEIPAWNYDRALQDIQADMRRQSPDRSLTPNQMALAQDQAWEQIVREQILIAEVQRRGLTVTDEEVLRVFRENPPPEILAAFVDEDGQPDLQAYYNALGNPASGINWPQVESWVRQNLPRQKLVLMLTAGVTVSEDEVRELFRQQYGQAVAEYMGLPLTDLAADYEPTPEEIQAYYESRAGEFQQGPQGQARIVAWEITPSASDFDEVRELALEVKEEIQTGVRSFSEAAAVYSEDGSADSGGDLGTFDRNRMVAPFTEAAPPVKSMLLVISVRSPCVSVREFWKRMRVSARRFMLPAVTAAWKVLSESPVVWVTAPLTDTAPRIITLPARTMLRSPLLTVVVPLTSNWKVVPAPVISMLALPSTISRLPLTVMLLWVVRFRSPSTMRTKFAAVLPRVVLRDPSCWVKKSTSILPSTVTLLALRMTMPSMALEVPMLPPMKMSPSVPAFR